MGSLGFDFLSVLPGDIVAIRVNTPTMSDYVGLVLHVIKSPRDPSCSSLIQVVDIDSGRISTVNADRVLGIIEKKMSL